MQTFDSTELTAMRAEMATTFTGSCIIRRRTAPTSDGAGGVADTTTDQSAVACLLQPFGATGGPSESANEGDKLASTTNWRVLLPYGTGAKAGDRLSISSVLYEVLGTNVGRGIPLCEDLTVARLL